MKKLRVIPSLLATILVVSNLVVSNLVAQSASDPVANDLSGPSEISAARSKYLEEATGAAKKDSQTEAQLRRRGPGMPMPPRGHHRGSYPTPWMANSDPGHVLIGAGIGF